MPISALNTGERARFIAVTDSEGNTITIAEKYPERQLTVPE